MSFDLEACADSCGVPVCSEACDREARREHDGRDAERYRHLRDIAGNDIMRKLMEEARPSHWDSIVDAAIARGKE